MWNARLTHYFSAELCTQSVTIEIRNLTQNQTTWQSEHRAPYGIRLASYDTSSAPVPHPHRENLLVLTSTRALVSQIPAGDQPYQWPRRKLGRHRRLRAYNIVCTYFDTTTRTHDCHGSWWSKTYADHLWIIVCRRPKRTDILLLMALFYFQRRLERCM